MSTDVIETRAHKVSEHSLDAAMMAREIRETRGYPTSYSIHNDWRRDVVIVYHAESDTADVKRLLKFGGYES